VFSWEAEDESVQELADNFKINFILCLSKNGLIKCSSFNIDLILDFSLPYRLKLTVY